MIKSYLLLKPLTDQLMKEVRAYGILEVFFRTVSDCL